MAKKVLKIDFEKDFEYAIAGIICGYKDYKLCFELNNALDLKFIRYEDVIIDAGRPGSSTRHSYFNFQGNNTEEFHLITNRDKANTGSFIPEKKDIDYFLLISGFDRITQMNKLIKVMRSIQIVSGVYFIDQSELDSIEPFLHFLEN